jgi:hypothetical protein
MATLSIAIDWDNDGFGAGDDITGAVIALDSASGFGGEPDHVAQGGQCTITVDNGDRRFSPAYAAGPLYGKLIPHRAVRVQATEGAQTWTLFRGTTRQFRPAPGVGGTARAQIVCQDALGGLGRDTLSLPLQEHCTADHLLKLITAEIFRGGVATAVLTCAANTEWHTVNGVRYSFVAALTGAPYEVLNDSRRAENFAAAIHRDTGEGVRYGSLTDRQEKVTAAVINAQTVELAANGRGAWGNALTVQSKLAGSGAGAVIAFTGGSDAPAGLIDFPLGEQVFPLAADRWSEERTTGSDALRDVLHSEYGYLWVARNGTLTFRARSWEFARTAAAPVLTVSGTATGLDGVLDEDRIFNRIVVSYVPRGTEDPGVIARAQKPIRVPGKSGITLPVNGRWNRAIGYIGDSSAGTPQTTPPQPGHRLVRLPFIQPESGQVIGARDVITPAAGLDYRVYEMEDKAGFDYTASGPVTISMAVTGTGVELTFQNTALGPLFVCDLQVRGTAIIAYDEQQAIREDDGSIATYGQRTLRYDIPLETGEIFAEAVADYLLGRHKTPAYAVDRLTFDGPLAVGGVSVLSVEIGDVIVLSEDQTGIGGQRYLVRGVEYAAAGEVIRVTFRLKRLDDVTYWILGDPTYGALDSTTRIAL